MCTTCTLSTHHHPQNDLVHFNPPFPSWPWPQSATSASMCLSMAVDRACTSRSWESSTLVSKQSKTTSASHIIGQCRIKPAFRPQVCTGASFEAMGQFLNSPLHKSDAQGAQACQHVNLVSCFCKAVVLFMDSLDTARLCVLKIHQAEAVPYCRFF